MGCILDDFTLQGRWKRTKLSDGRILETAKAKTKWLETDGVLYKINGVFQGFTGTEEAARYWAEKQKKMLQ